MRPDPPDMTKARLKRAVQSLDALPSPSAVAVRVLSLAASTDVDIQALAKLLETEPALSLAILRQANSPTSGLGHEVRDIRQAIMALGMDTVRTLALCAVVRDGLFASPEAGDPQVRRVWEHSLACAVAAQLLAERSKRELSGQAFAAGLLHDCGKLALLTALPDEYGRLFETPDASASPGLEAEEKACGVDHCLAGKWLLERWGLPRFFVDVAWLHHHPPEALKSLDENSRLLVLTALADRLAHEAMGEAPPPDPGGERGRLLRAAGLTDPEAVTGEIGIRFASHAGLFDFSEDPVSFYFQALQRANRRLGQVGLAIARRREDLERANRLFEGVAEAGILLSSAPDEPALLEVLARNLAGLFASPEGLAYVLDSAAGLFLARHWGGRTPGGSVTSRLGENGRADPAQLGALPEGPRSLLASAEVRAAALPGKAGASLHLQAGYAVATLRLEESLIVEMIFRPASGKLAPLEHSAYRHLAGLAGAAVRRLRLLEEGRERAERLAEAMRSMQAMNVKLMQTERLAAVGQLAAGAAHEINNPLAIVSARAQLLEMKEADPARKKNFRQMVEQIERISSILGQLMDFARPAQPRAEPVDLRLVLDKTLDLVESSLEKRGIAVKRSYPAQLPTVLADPRQLEQVFLNLFINADHAMETTGQTLTVTVAFDQAADMAVVTVADTGVGIAPENLEKIFDPFFTTKAEGKGTGLGLSTVYGILAKHQGDIAVDSKPGAGTVVTVRLPRDPTVRPTGVTTRTGGTAPQDEEAILVADDEKNIRDILRESLESSGYRVATAADGEECLELLSARRYKLLILDIRMPRRDGLALLREAKGLIPPTMPVLVLTGLAGEDEIREALALGAAGCVRKPFQVEALLGEVRRLLAAAPAGA